MKSVPMLLRAGNIGCIKRKTLHRGVPSVVARKLFYEEKYF